jgi:protease-4
MTRIGLALLALVGSGCVTIDLPVGRPGPLVETVLEGEGPAKVLLLEIDGVISESVEPTRFGFDESESVVARARSQLEKARRDDDVVALVLRIQSPGGTATASEILYREILRFKEESGVPVVAALMGVATSGAYYAAMAADTVLAHPTTVTGSIGVIFRGVNVSGLMGKLGIQDQTITSGEYKDAGSPLREMRPEERRQIQGILDDLHERFREVVAEGRPQLGRERVAELADGRIYSAEQALALGLVDGVADLPGAIDEAKRRAGTAEARVVSFHRERDWRENLYTQPPAAQAPLLGLATLLQLRSPSFLYLWWPGLD